MNKKAFTLIELLAVITILSIIILIVSISVSDMLKESKQELSEAQIKSIKEATKSWSSDNMDILPTNNDCSFILLKDLKDNGLLDSKIINPKDNKSISNEMKIKISSKIGNNGKSILDYEVDSNDTRDCTYIGSNLYVDLLEGLTPVLYDEKLKSWRVPNINEEWYNYDKQMWANAVVLGKGKTKKPGETVKVDGTEALMMLVYIPRYEYKIEGEYGKHPDGTDGTQELPGEIKVKFVNNNQIKADSEYIMHPAFTFGNQELSGIWVGKFELSHETLSNNLECSTTSCTNTEGIRVLPNINILRGNNVLNFWYGIKSIENTSSFGLSNMDTHMIKNSEWGAVAYLSQSKYGKYGNSDYEGIYKEVYQNKSEETGSSNGTPSQETAREDGQCTYNDMTNLEEDSNGYKMGQCGPGASTTGNIYGVYDMNGGVSEYAMAMHKGNDDIIIVSSSGFEVTDFDEYIPSKYYDLYVTTDGYITSCDNGKCLGHALTETKNWYNNVSSLIDSGSWFARGGYYNFSTAGIFGYYIYKGDGDGTNTTRVIFISK